MSQPRPTPRQLDAFIAAAELANFTQTAARLHLTPSAVSNLVNELERTLGFALFERTTRKVVLTAAGREFLPSAIAVQRQLARAGLAALDIRDRATEVVRIAAPMAVAAIILPRLIAEHRTIRERTAIRVVDAGVEWLADRIAIGDADLALGPDRAVQSDVVSTRLFASPWLVWCSPLHPLMDRPTLVWADLLGIEVYAAGRDHEHSVQPLLPPKYAAALMASVRIVDNLSTALGLAAAGLGVTFSPDYVRPLATSLGLESRPLGDPEIIRHMCLYRPAERSISAAATAFGEFLIARQFTGPASS